jgi:hypothetical protein
MNRNIDPTRATDRPHRPARKWHGMGTSGFRKPPVVMIPDTHPSVGRRGEQPDAVLLGMIPTLRFVTPAGLHTLADVTTHESTSVGQDVIRQGEASDAVFFVVSGAFDVVISHFGQAPDFIRTLHAGDSFGELGVLYDVPRTATVRCTDSGEILRIPGDAFLDALDDVR